MVNPEVGREGFTLTEADFIPVGAFTLKWRWTQETHAVLPPDDLAAIRPLTRVKAEQAWHYSAAFVDHTPYEEGLPTNLFTEIRRQDTSGDEEAVRDWLCVCVPPDSGEIIVSWSHREAVLTRWDTFCRYWEDFCYPGGDNIIIWPVTEAWGLVYWHEEQFTFGIRRKGI